MLSNCAMQPRVDALQIILSRHVSSKIPQDRSSGVPNGYPISGNKFVGIYRTPRFFTYCLLRLAYAHCRNRMPDVQKHLKRAKAYFRRQGKRIVLQNAESNPMAEAAFENPMYRAKRKTTMKTSMQAKRLEMRKIRTSKHARLGNSLLHPIRTPAQIGPHATLPPKSRAVQVLRQRIECARPPAALRQQEVRHHR